jgi:hypothetical protein
MTMNKFMYGFALPAANQGRYGPTAAAFVFGLRSVYLRKFGPWPLLTGRKKASRASHPKM